MTNFAGKAVKAFLLSVGAVLLLTASAFAAEADIAAATQQPYQDIEQKVSRK